MNRGHTQNELVDFILFEHFLDDPENETLITKIRKETQGDWRSTVNELIKLCSEHYGRKYEVLSSTIYGVWQTLDELRHPTYR
ncbi:MAG: hypothetical protein HY644_02515 [Acidobacteria bacterium]|nr:hypothetical protein [Acidobacteriota bacterium]